MARNDAVTLYVHDGASAQAAVTTRVKVTQFTAAFNADAGDAGVAADTSNDEIDIDGGGTYLVQYNLSVEAGAATTVQVHLAADGTEVEGYGSELDIIAAEADKAFQMACSAVYSPGAPGTTIALSLYVESANSAAILLEQGQFTVIRID